MRLLCIARLKQCGKPSNSEAGGQLVFGLTKAYDDRTIIIPGFLRSLLAEHLATRTRPEESA